MNKTDVENNVNACVCVLMPSAREEEKKARIKVCESNTQAEG